MAEARSVIGMSENIRGGGVKLNMDTDRLHVTLRFGVPLRWAIIRRWARKRYDRSRNLLINGTYPLGPIALLVVMVAVTAFVVLADRDHWIRQGRLGHLVWNVGMMFPLVQHLPLALRVGWFTMWAAFIGFLVLVFLQRYLLRMLFSYQAFLYASRGKKTPLAVTIWGALVKVLSGRKPLTYGFDGTLPSLPLPGIDKTCQRWLQSMEAHQSREEFKKSQALVTQFLAKEGPTLQKYLRLKHLVSRNYVADWWEKYCYHKGRSSIMINSNYYVLDGAFKCPTGVRNARIGQVLHNMLAYNLRVERERIPPMLIGNMVPMDMGQHRRMFATTRIPGRDCDSLKHVDYDDTKHVAVLYRGYWYKLDVIRKNGAILTARELETLLDVIVEEAAALGPVDEAEGSVAALTAGNRTNWAEARETYFADGLNRASLSAIESAILVVSLTDDKPADSTDQSRRLIHGTGSNIWFDKSITLVGFGNGRIGLNVEHSWADAPVIAHMMEYCVMTGEMIDGAYQDDGHTRETPASGPTPPRHAARILFDLPRSCRTAILSARSTAQAAIADLDLRMNVFDTYGKGFVKSIGVSPDAYVQMALQITYYELMGRFDQTYESGMTRLFKDGRTETIRPVSLEAAAFVKAFLDDDVPAAEKHRLLQAASARHVTLSLDAMTGKGVDRHLFALYIVSVGKEIDSPFLKAAMGEPWRLSTSQQPQQQTKRWNTRNKEDCKRLCLGGGFGPVADDGYMVAGEDHIFFHVSSKRSCPATDSTAFVDKLSATLRRMQATFASLATKGKQKTARVTSAAGKAKDE